MTALYLPDSSPKPTASPILVQTPAGEFWASKQEVLDFCDSLWDAAAKNPIVAPVIPEGIDQARSKPGAEVVAKWLSSNSQAFRLRLKLEKLGYECRTKKHGERFAVYAIWPERNGVAA